MPDNENDIEVQAVEAKEENKAKEDFQKSPTFMSFIDKYVDKTLEVNLVPKPVNADGIAEIGTILLRSLAKFGRFDPNQDSWREVIARFPDNWSWYWKVDKDENGFRGTLPKRIFQFARKEWDVKLANSTISRIGDEASRHSLSENARVFDFTYDLTWRDGKFADEGSCFWDGNPTRAYMMANKVGAMRFYDIAKIRGKGRCWMIPDFPSRKLITLFNAYGHLVSDFASALSDYLEVEWAFIRLDNNYDSIRQIYLNGDGVTVGETAKKYNDGSYYHIHLSEEPGDEHYRAIGYNIY